MLEGMLEVSMHVNQDEEMQQDLDKFNVKHEAKSPSGKT